MNQKPLNYVYVHGLKTEGDEAAKAKQVTQGHNIVADKWAGASNPHTHPIPSPKRILNARFPTFQLDDPGRTDRHMDGRSL